jgi:putative oxidoreductase
MEQLRRISRILLGIILIVFGLNAFYNFLGLPEMPAEAREVFDYMGYMIMYAVMFQLLIGVLLLINRFVPLALLVLAPISLNILAFHLFFFPAGILPGLVVAVLNVFLLTQYLEFFKPFLRSKANK